MKETVVNLFFFDPTTRKTLVLPRSGKETFSRQFPTRIIRSGEQLVIKSINFGTYEPEIRDLPADWCGYCLLSPFQCPLNEMIEGIWKPIEQLDERRLTLVSLKTLDAVTQQLAP